MEFITVSLGAVQEALKEAAEESAELAAEGTKKAAVGLETGLDFANCRADFEVEHIHLGKFGVEGNEAPIKIGSEEEVFFCSEFTGKSLVNEIRNNSSSLETAIHEIKKPRHITTINEALEGETYPGTGVEYIKHTFILNGETVEGVFPRFKSRFDTALPENLLQSSDTEQFKYCTQRLAELIESDSGFRAQFTQRQIEQIKNGEPRISGLTWHHNEVPGRVQLVNADVHSICRHTGGRSIWGGGTDCR